MQKVADETDERRRAQKAAWSTYLRALREGDGVLTSCGGHGILRGCVTNIQENRQGDERNQETLVVHVRPIAIPPGTKDTSFMFHESCWGGGSCCAGCYGATLLPDDGRYIGILTSP